MTWIRRNNNDVVMLDEKTSTISKDIDINKLASNYSKRANSNEQNTSIQMDRMNSQLIDSIKSSKENQVDANNDRYPYCIVWTPLPLITWFLPFIGHMGICTSAGVIRDFAGPYFVSVTQIRFFVIRQSAFSKNR